MGWTAACTGKTQHKASIISAAKGKEGFLTQEGSFIKSFLINHLKVGIHIANNSDIYAGVMQEMGISFQQALGVHPQAVKLRLERTELLTANLANVDTPNFKAKDIDFAREMQRANNAVVDVQYRVPMQPSEDGNTVELNSEQARFSQNSMDYQSSLTFLNLQLSGIKEAIEGK